MGSSPYLPNPPVPTVSREDFRFVSQVPASPRVLGLGGSSRPSGSRALDKLMKEVSMNGVTREAVGQVQGPLVTGTEKRELAWKAQGQGRRPS